jgi:inner membrane protein
MEALIDAWQGFGAWRWLAIGALLLAAEFATGTAWLLWLAAAAGLTAILVALPIPTSFTTELLAFGAFALGTTAFGRRFFPPNAIKSDQPLLNQPNSRALGASVVVVSDFVGGEGRVKMGDTEWQAVTLDGASPKAGAQLQVLAMDGARLKVSGVS